jgi:hypothetical protein
VPSFRGQRRVRFASSVGYGLRVGRLFDIAAAECARALSFPRGSNLLALDAGTMLIGGKSALVAAIVNWFAVPVTPSIPSPHCW